MPTKTGHRLNTGRKSKIPISLLQTKLYAPSPPSRVVHRPRLVVRLNEGLQRKLTLISAPAGFGKTVLLSEWITDVKQPVSWLSLDDSDNDPALFVAYLIAALRTKEANVGQAAMPALQSQSHTISIESILSAVINELHEKEAEVVLILEDYHKITSKAIHNAVTFLIDHMPPKIHLVIAGRADPPLHLAHLRSLDQLTELRAADLRFTIDETTAFFNKVMNLGLSQEDIVNLETRTEGWVASLEMAALAMRDREDIANFIANFSGSHRYVVDYLTEEVLQRQEKDIKSFLLKTAILGRMTGPLCDALTGRSDGQAMLEHLEATNLFIIPLDDERLWYRYYPLFADVLRNKLNRSTPNLVDTLHRQASEWFEQQELIDEAVHHALATEDFGRAAGLIEIMSEEILKQGRITTLFSLLQQLPQEVITRRPRLCFNCAWAYLMAGQENNVEPLLKAAEKGLSNETNADQELIKGHVLGIRGYMAKWQGNILSAINNCEEALKFFPEDEPRVRPLVLGNIGHAYFEKGDMPRAKEYMEYSCKNGRAVGNIFTAVAAKGFLSYILIEQGQLREAAKVCQQTIQLGRELSGWYPLTAAGHACIGLGQVLYEQNNLKHAKEQLTKGIELGETGQFWVVAIKGYLALAQLEQAMGNEGAAVQAEVMAEATAPKILMARESCHISSWKARLALARGDLPAAVQWANSQEHKLSLSDIPDYRLEPLYLTLLRVKIAQGEVDKEIASSLGRFRQKAEAEGRMRTVIEILTLQALAFTTMDETDLAIAALEQALLLAESEGYVRLFLECGPPMHQLLREVATHVRAHQYVVKLLKAFKVAGSTTLTPSNKTETPLLDILNEREIAILRLKGTHSDREIAKALYLSVNTIKWYAHRIYSKLGVSNRAEAINLAHELNIL